MAPWAGNKFGAPMLETKVLWEQMYFVEESTWENLALVGARQ